MPLRFKDKKVVLSGAVGVEEAEQLLEWLHGRKEARVVLADCTHMHPANLQVLLAAGVQVSTWPADSALTMWLQSVLPSAQASNR